MMMAGEESTEAELDSVLSGVVIAGVVLPDDAEPNCGTFLVVESSVVSGVSGRVASTSPSPRCVRNIFRWFCSKS